MKTFKEVKEIAKCIMKIGMLVDKLRDHIDIEGINWYTAAFVQLDKDLIELFNNSNGVTDEYFVTQWTGSCGDDYYGYLYFKTDVEGLYVKVYFEM